MVQVQIHWCPMRRIQMWRTRFQPLTASPPADWTSFTRKLCQWSPPNVSHLLSSCGSQLDAEALVAAVRAIEALAHERTVARLKQEPNEASATQSHAAHPEAFARPQAYDPASMFLLETMVSIACQTPQHIDDLWYGRSSISHPCC